MKYILYPFVIAILSVLSSCGDTPTDEQKKETIENILLEYNDCVANAESNKDCKSFTARAICEYNGIDDLKKDGDFVMYNEIHDFVLASENWTTLGFADSQETLSEAQRLANEDYPVIAIKTADKYKFAVIIIKGELKKSNKWNSDVPSCAVFFPASSKMESFIDKTINYAWSSPEGVEFFIRK
ncbi:MAG: hypothetical protein ACI8Q1_001634 [Parvicella sp.]|jgi:hypothetical protein